jgi:prepilin-type N-terminal cleavage/methylation domain-containing protein
MARRKLSNHRQGHTLVELLIAIIVAGLVVSMASAVLLWAYRQSHGSLGTTDRLERHQLLRQGMFQLGRQGRTIQLQADHWTLFRRTQEREDTLHIRCRDTALVRDEVSLTRGDSVVSCRFAPVFPHSLPDKDAWLDVVGSTLEPPATDSLVFVRLTLVLQAPQVRGAAPVSPDTLDLRIPL